MATYNGERFLQEQLESFSAQSRKPDELVVCDDGSTDSTISILEHFAASAQFEVRLHRNATRLNFSRNFERAISLCSGDIIFLSDQDDVWFADKIERVCGLFDSEPGVQAVLSGQVITDAALKHENVTLLDNVRALGKGPDDLVAGCATALRGGWAKLLLPLPAGQDGLIAADFLTYDRWINELSAMLQVRRFIETPLQFFRRHSSNTTQSAHHSLTGVGSIELIADRRQQAPAEAWARRTEVLNLYDDWISAHERALRDLGAAIDQARAAIADERNCLLARIALVSRPFFGRARGVIRLWMAGGYAHFNGWKSALNDLARQPGRRLTQQS